MAAANRADALAAAADAVEAAADAAVAAADAAEDSVSKTHLSNSLLCRRKPGRQTGLSFA